ncbi:sigma-E factor negative regulatory protein [Nitrogeniibacter mangrovi]|uniref:Sigma-E factor negative regulatory protein n=1 Tax=Nitrogeniibacter mangrovi TaxID=2016596 RepID=A0A6C1B2A1_9RHOO|nr:sigma-E factor negative regulatory protein [Nitrogeniibacter mangrovi]QID17766.1 sigma-E factor negative regulatory protein [Nitrogeniibacter mangrovi]
MKERISALIDGHFDEAPADGGLIGKVVQSDEGRSTWSTYCLIGDVLRDEPAGAADLTASIMARLEAEPTVLAPVSVVQARQRTQGVWSRILPLAASVMGVAAVGWVALQLNAKEAPTVVAKAVEPVAPIRAVVAPVDGDRQLARDTALRAFVLAHQGTVRSALPGVAPYVRTVAEMPQARQ